MFNMRAQLAKTNRQNDRMVSHIARRDGVRGREEEKKMLHPENVDTVTMGYIYIRIMNLVVIHSFDIISNNILYSTR